MPHRKPMQRIFSAFASLFRCTFSCWWSSVLLLALNPRCSRTNFSYVMHPVAYPSCMLIGGGVRSKIQNLSAEGFVHPLLFSCFACLQMPGPESWGVNLISPSSMTREKASIFFLSIRENIFLAYVLFERWYFFGNVVISIQIVHITIILENVILA